MNYKRNLSYSWSEAKNAGRVDVRLWLLVVGLVMASALPTLGQSTVGSVRGTVQDKSGAAIGGAKVVLHSTDENSDKMEDADASGDFSFENVKAGHYTLRGSQDGFAETVISGISLEARQDLRLTLSLEIAAQTTTVQVVSDAA
jgi:hypothetical protein